MAARSTQNVVASLTVRNASFVLVTQCVVEALVPLGPARARATQFLLEAIGNTLARASVTLFAIQILIVQPVRGTAIALEVLYQLAKVRPMPAIYPELPGLTYSVIKRPKWFTGVGTSVSGREVRVAYAQNPLWEWDLTYTYLPDKQTETSATQSDLKQLLGFYLAQFGSFQGFLFRDPDDHAVIGQYVGVGDGVTTTFTLVRTFGGGDGAGTEPIGYVDQSQPFVAYVGGVPIASSLVYADTAVPVGQRVKFNEAPAAGAVVTVSFGYLYYVRFKDDHYDFEKFMDRLWSTATITLMSQRG